MLKVMSTIHAYLKSWEKYRRAVSELSKLSDRDLADIGISRCDIQTVAKESAQRELSVA